MLVVLLGAPALALAGKPDDAKAHVARATEAHKDGRYDEARVELEAAYALDPRPDLLYALGQIHAKLGDCREAINYFKRFRATQQDQQVATVVDQAIAACKPATGRDEPAPRDGAPPADPSPPSSADRPKPAPASQPSPVAQRSQPFVPTRTAPTVQPRSPWYKDKLGGGLLLGGVAVAVIGLVEYRSAVSELDAAEDRASTTTLEQFRDRVDSAHSMRNASIMLVGTGGALIAGGIVRYVLQGGNTEARGVGVAPARGGGVVTYGGSL